MSSMINKVDLIAALRLRYDHYSAPTIFEAAIAAAGLRDQESYDGREVRVWREALMKVGDRLESVQVRLDALAGTPGEAAPKRADAKAEPAPVAVDHPPSSAATKAEPAPAGTAPPTVAPAPKRAEPTAAEPAKDAPSAATRPGDETSTSVKLVGIDVAAGEQVLVCGSFVDWNVDRAVAMKRSGDAWLATIPVAPSTKIVFKFLRHTADGKVVWEGGDDRKLAGSRIEATWQAEDAT